MFINTSVTHQLFSFNIYDSQFLSIESAGVVVFGVIIGRIWLYFGKIGKPIHDVDKFNIGFILMGIMLAGFYAAIVMSATDAQINGLVFAVGFLILAMSELCLSAIGLSMVTKIAPKDFVSLYMVIWLVTLGIGGKLAGLIAQFVHIDDNIVSSKASMAHGMLIFIAITVFAIILCLLFRKIVIKHYPIAHH